MIVPYSAEAETRQFLRDVFDVGLEKPMGYVSGELVRAAGLDVTTIKTLLEVGAERGAYVLEESECSVFGGAVYAYHHNALAVHIKEYEDTLWRAGWLGASVVTSVRRFVLAVATVTVRQEDNPRLYECIGRAFADRRFRPPFKGSRTKKIRKVTHEKKRRAQ